MRNIELKMRVVFIFILFLKCNLAQSQNVTCLYELTYKTKDSDSFTKRENYYLDISGSQSVFRSQKDKSIDFLNHNIGRGASNYLIFNQLYTRKDLSKNNIFKVISSPLHNDLYEILIDDKQNWKVFPETKLIANLSCQKAELNYGGRIWEAWFTSNIPFQEGPYIFHGLPGLIVSISDRNKDYDFNLIRLDKVETDSYSTSKKGKLIDWALFEKLQKNFYSEPFAELKAKSSKIIVTEDKGNQLDRSFDDMSKKMQKTLRENNNPIELNHKIEYK